MRSITPELLPGWETSGCCPEIVWGLYTIADRMTLNAGMTELARQTATDTDTDGPGRSPELDHLVTVLDLERIETNIYRGYNANHPSRHVFGGQAVGQALVAAGRTVPEGRDVHSLHAYFIRGGDLQAPIVYEVDPIRDGRSFTTRRVVAIQHGKAIFSLMVSFQKPEASVEHAEAMPEVPQPEELPTLADHVAQQASRLGELDSPLGEHVPKLPIDIRYIHEPPWMTRGIEQPAQSQVWMRADGTLSDDGLLQASVLAYASDMMLFDSVLTRHGVYWDFDKVLGASLDHAIWFHRPFRADEWFLYDITSPTASGARALLTARCFARDGTHFATVVQEGLLRIR